MRTPSLVGVSFMSALEVEDVQCVGSTWEPVSGSDHTGAAEADVATATTPPTMRMKRTMKDEPKRKPLANVISYGRVQGAGASLATSRERGYEILVGLSLH